MFTYRTYFNLTNRVNDLWEAQDFLKEDDMTDYLKKDNNIAETIKNKISKIEWILKDKRSGHIDLTTTEEMSDIELNVISKWVSGQNSDGLGESFEQQDFANYCYADTQEFEDKYSRYGNDYDEEYDEAFDTYITASFDWETNDYIFEFISEN